MSLQQSSRPTRTPDSIRAAINFEVSVEEAGLDIQGLRQYLRKKILAVLTEKTLPDLAEAMAKNSERTVGGVEFQPRGEAGEKYSIKASETDVRVEASFELELRLLDASKATIKEALVAVRFQIATAITERILQSLDLEQILFLLQKFPQAKLPPSSSSTQRRKPS